ncbi:3-oxoacyl-[acyl-carrier-protein] reductase FabG [Providencia rustigianii]|uniref:3-oxoacyl-[acyl-carrier-protein] reductase FabG n=1 Tax=Providencia rustigianii TaxID=158850 RepID=A0A379G8D5_9GAMM|nr:SDR family oxidoreductase [Providencia rustigianii]SUC37289.1 3-oxoacyl-[acyl-carrier-protein] reductase FabG [Providencia rustigianii]
MINNLLKNKKILITGASSGIGRVVAQFFSTQGAQLVITGRNESRLTETFQKLHGLNHLQLTADITDLSSITTLVKSSVDFLGPLDGIVHCAGIQKTLPLQILKEEQFDEIFTTNIKSAQFLTKELRKKGNYNKGCSLIYISSVAGVCGEPAITTYSASKAALMGLTKSAAIELARNNIRVNCIAPGHVSTEMAVDFSKKLTKEQLDIIEKKHPLGLGKPEDIAHAAAYLVSNLSSWVTGTTLFVDGGYSAH